MMFNTVVSGWLLYYFIEMAKGTFQGISAKEIANVFSGLINRPEIMILCTAVITILSFGICFIGLQKGVGRVTKTMMSLLLILLLVLTVKSVTLPNAEEGLRYYLYPDFGTMLEIGLPECIFAAMGQAFFTLSIGIGTLSVFFSGLFQFWSGAGQWA